MLIAIVVIIAAVLVISWLQDQRARTRVQQRQARAAALGLEPLEGPPHAMRRRARGLILLAQGESSSFDHGMEGTIEDVEGITVTLFDFTFNVSVGGRYTRAWKQTVLLLSDEDLDLPAFTLLPDEDAALMLTNAANDAVKDRLLGSVSARFEDHPVFNDHLHLQGADRTAIQDLFHDELITFYEEHTDLCTEGRDDQLFFYYYDEILSAGQLDDFVQTALKAYRLMKRGGPR
jgi:hypothetical protein